MRPERPPLRWNARQERTTSSTGAHLSGPLEGCYNPDKEKIRIAVNDWIRTSGEFDGVIDFDALARDPARPRHIKAECNSGDNLHPNDAAYEAMAGSIDLGMLKGNK
jgi:lysophospholipase L1-like esterase